MKYNEIKQNELTSREYTKQYRYYSDYITEYEYISENNLTMDEFEKILETGKAYLYGTISFIKKQLTFSNGITLYKHVCQVINY